MKVDEFTMNEIVGNYTDDCDSDELLQSISMSYPVYLRAVDGRKMACFFSKMCPLSNKYKCEFEVNGEKFTSMDQYYQHANPILFGTEEEETDGENEDPMHPKIWVGQNENHSRTDWLLNCNKVTFCQIIISNSNF